ncbi:hypothetical protein DFJ58DRAFT_845402 [Suillus subalutaceus]|uniref:uncharacterized protein n=1 Tax=Suillus subalutaceus TaxID=48586 RepID=UPI001B864FC2|nr:uncharacterized protein DFJ58DRAFT_845402 [Suillus subalutaceus]KAG1840270.1 hypothetical protein DFJ58DRAFT_845402 [Suillus subalutaceus]
MAAGSARWHNALQLALQKEEGKKNVFQLATTDVNSATPYVRSHILRDHIIHPSLPSLPCSSQAQTSVLRRSLRSNPTLTIALKRTSGSKPQTRNSVSLGVQAIYPSPDLKETKGIEGVGEVYDAFRSQGWDWEDERRKQFDSVGAHMRASWCRPVPGSLMDSYSDAEKWPVKVAKPGEEGYDAKNYEEARGNFSLVLIDPVEVDYVELGVMPNRRTKFIKQETENERWKEVIVVP